ncbi:centromere protein S-like [Lycorma delicatula]|uniref:centromere protein S-like n=1 Tax=Lycorma delicatula TaxID=130591 RepID=UPI003F5169A1
MMNNPSLLTVDEKLKASFYYSVSKISKSVGNNNTVIGPFNIDKDAIELIAELLYKKLELYSEDLEAFAKNRKQSTVNVEDVKLLARRNPQLKEHLSTFIVKNLSDKNEKKEKMKINKKTSDKKKDPKIEVIEVD